MYQKSTENSIPKARRWQDKTIKKEAISGIKGNVADISVKIAEKLIGETLDASAQSELINQYLEKLGE